MKATSGPPPHTHTLSTIRIRLSSALLTTSSMPTRLVVDQAGNSPCSSDGSATGYHTARNGFQRVTPRRPSRIPRHPIPSMSGSPGFAAPSTHNGTVAAADPPALAADAVLSMQSSLFPQVRSYIPKTAESLARLVQPCPLCDSSTLPPPVARNRPARFTIFHPSLGGAPPRPHADRGAADPGMEAFDRTARGHLRTGDKGEPCDIPRSAPLHVCGRAGGRASGVHPHHYGATTRQAHPPTATHAYVAGIVTELTQLSLALFLGSRFPSTHHTPCHGPFRSALRTGVHHHRA